MTDYKCISLILRIRKHRFGGAFLKKNCVYHFFVVPLHHV